MKSLHLIFTSVSTSRGKHSQNRHAGTHHQACSSTYMQRAYEPGTATAQTYLYTATDSAQHKPSRQHALRATHTDTRKPNQHTYLEVRIATPKKSIAHLLYSVVALTFSQPATVTQGPSLTSRPCAQSASTTTKSFSRKIESGPKSIFIIGA
jgi:hypothetical protein